MQLTFSEQDFEFKRVKIKTVSIALGGSLTYLDEENSTETKQVWKRIEVPLAVARMFKVKYTVTSYITPYEGCLMLFRGACVAVERNIVNNRYEQNLAGETVEWTPRLMTNMKRLFQEIESTGRRWLCDGSFAYCYKVDTDDDQIAFNHGSPICGDGTFRAVQVTAYQLSYLMFNEPTTHTRQSVAYQPAPGVLVVTPPIWQNLGNTAQNSTDKGIDRDDERASIGNFDQVDEKMAVNLNFALAAGRALCDEFGFESIAPLMLPKLMIRLNTVNLPNMPVAVKATYDIGLTFTHGMAWLCGLLHQSTRYEQIIAVRKLLKYLTTRGIFIKNATNKSRVLKHNVENTDTNSLYCLTGEEINNIDHDDVQLYLADKMAASFLDRS